MHLSWQQVQGMPQEVLDLWHRFRAGESAAKREQTEQRQRQDSVRVVG
jgi:hypothetical protein